MKKKLGVFIPGRLSSERLPNKLILPLGGSCLWEIACRKLNELPDKYNKYALCYDDDLIQIAKKYPNIKVVKRDKATADAEGPMSFIFKDLEGVEDTHLMFLNPCLYNLSVHTIKRSLDEFEASQYDCATSVKSYKNWLFDSSGKPITDIDFRRLSTKEITGYYHAAHCFHIFNKERLFFGDGMVLDKNLQIIEIPEEETLDVDTKEDYEYAKFRLRKRKKYVIDIDGTICETNGLNYSTAKPIIKNIKRFNKLYNEGHTIWYQTARGAETGIDWREITEKQLKEWGVKYHKLLFGKPSADVYIDDKAINITDIDYIEL